MQEKEGNLEYDEKKGVAEEIERLNKDLEFQKKMVSEYVEKIKSLESDYEQKCLDYRIEIGALEVEISEFKGEIEELEEENEKLNESNLAAEAKIPPLQVEIDVEREAKKEREKELCKANELLRREKVARENIEHSNRRLKDKNDGLEEIIESLNSDLSSVFKDRQEYLTLHTKSMLENELLKKRIAELEELVPHQYKPGDLVLFDGHSNELGRHVITVFPFSKIDGNVIISVEGNVYPADKCSPTHVILDSDGNLKEIK